MTTLRPSAARWFELLTDREHLGRVLSVLGQTGAVQLEAYSDVDAHAALPDYARALEHYRQLARRYAAYWPDVRVDAATAATRSADRVQEDLERLEAWAAAADPLIEQLQALGSEQAGVVELAGVLEAAGGELPDLELLSNCGPTLRAEVYALEAGTAPLSLPPGVLHLVLHHGDKRYLLALGSAEELADLEGRLATLRPRRLQLPHGLPGERSSAIGVLRERSEALDAQLAAQRQALAALSDTHALPGLLAEFSFLDWLVSHVPQLPATQHFAWVTGWTSDLGGKEVEDALARAGVPGLLNFPEAPRNFDAPVVMTNPAWAKPFEVFVKLLGTPGPNEADPSPLIAIIAPLLFGFMFGDVGQGAVLLVAGLLLYKRFPPLRLLIPGGLSAIAFGFAFGSIFAREDIIPALWLHPLEEPITLVIASILIGIGVILLGLVIDGVEHAWRGAGRSWLASRAGLLAMYIGVISIPLWPAGGWLVLAGLLWFLVGAAFVEHAVAAAGRALGEVIETGLQLVVNTISFERVSIFALAHSGLSLAVVSIGEATGSRIGFWLALVIGNIVILVLEGLIVSIQTTRLVLFEFFIRFLRGEGRPFKPLPPPGSGVPVRK